MKRLILFLSLVLCGEAHSAQIANVEYIHNAIAQEWDITAPYNSKLINPRAAGTFYGCTSLTGQSAQINGKYLYNIYIVFATTYMALHIMQGLYVIQTQFKVCGRMCVGYLPF